MKISIGFLLLATATFLHAQVPQLINYQGRVAVGSVNFDGSGQFKFALVNASGTTTFWSNDGTSVAGTQPTAAVPLTVSKGLYSVLLGDISLTAMTAIPSSVFANADVRLRVWFNDGTNGFQLLAPDQRLAPNGYLADGSVATATLASGAVTTAKIAAGAVTNTAIASGLDASKITLGTFPALSGANLTGLTADNITAGTLADARLSANVALRDAANTFTNTLSVSTVFVVQPRPLNTAQNNLFAGFNSGVTNTTGAGNTFVGTNAGWNNSTGASNAFFGFRAGVGNTFGNSVTSVGAFAGFSNTSGNSNTFLGAGAGQNNTTGSGNIAVGQTAGINLTTGSNNIAIGNRGVAAETGIIRIGTPGTQTDTFLTGVVHGNGAGLTGITSTGLEPGSVTSTQLASNLTLAGTTTGESATFSGNVGIGTTTPADPLQIGAFSTAADQYFSVKTAGGSLYRAGIKFRHFNDTFGFNIEDDDHAGSYGLNFIRYYLGSSQSAMFIDRVSGNVGIGTTTPGAPLDVLGQMQIQANGTIRSIGSANNYNGMIETSYGAPNDRYGIGQFSNGITAVYTSEYYGPSSIQFGLITGASSFAPKMTIDHSGNVGLGTTTPGARLDVVGDVRVGGTGSTFELNGGLDFLTTAAIRQASAERPVILSARATSNAELLLITNPADSRYFTLGIVAGNAGKPGGGSWGDTSDRRLKKNIAPMTGALDKITRLRGVNFDWINPDAHNHDAKRQGGFIAQEIAEVFPAWVEKMKPQGKDAALCPDGVAHTLSLPFEFNALVVEAMKEQQQQIAQLRDENAALKKQLAASAARDQAIEARLARLEQAALAAPAKVASRE